MGTPQRSPRLQAGQQQQISVIPVKSKTPRKKGEPPAWQTTPLKTPSWDEEVPTAGNPLGQTSPLSQTSPPRTRVALSHPRSHLGGRALAATPTPALLMPSRQTMGTPRLWSCCAGEGWERRGGGSFLLGKTHAGVGDSPTRPYLRRQLGRRDERSGGAAPVRLLQCQDVDGSLGHVPQGRIEGHRRVKEQRGRGALHSIAHHIQVLAGKTAE